MKARARYHGAGKTSPAGRGLSFLFPLLLLFFLCLPSGCSKDPASPENGSISGRATLENSSDHGGILILLEDTGQSVTTESDGGFTIGGVSAGTHRLQASKDGYSTVTRENLTVRADQTTTVEAFTLLEEWIISADITAQTTWDAGRSIVIAGDIVVDAPAVLTIEDDVQVRFQDNAALRVEGTLIAAASDSARSIRFTSVNSSPSPGAWNRIYFDELPPENESRLAHCIIEYAGTGVICNSASPQIEECRILSCDYAAILCSNSSCRIENNLIQDCQHGIRCEAGSNEVIIHGNTLMDNYETGIACLESSPQIAQNHVQGADYGIWCEYHSFPLIEYNEIFENGTGIYIYTVSAPTIQKNTIHHNTDAIFSNNGSYPTVNQNNITDHEGWFFYLNNSATYDEQNVDAQNNWWGTVTISTIGEHIRDKNDVTPGLPIGYVIYDPILSSPDPTAGPTP